MKNLLTLCWLILLLSNCRTKMDLSSYNGIWQSIGHGEILEIKDGPAYSFYDITSISCVPRRRGSLDEITKTLTLEVDTLSLTVGAITTRYIKTSNLPLLCHSPVDENKARDPLYNFDVFMETVKEHYAFLHLNEINWEELYQQQKAKLNHNSNDADLYVLIEETYEILNDNHAYLDASDEVYDLLEDQYPEEETEDALPELGDFFVSQTVADHYLMEDMTKDSPLISWGKISANIGYIQLKIMCLYADLHLSDILIDSIGYDEAWYQAINGMYEGDYIEKEVEGVNRVMDDVMNDLQEMESIIIDIRFNGGGQDLVSFEIIGRFIQSKMQVANHKFKYGNRHTSVDPIYINGSEHPFLGPVYILTSPQTGSAAEVFAIASMSLPHMTRIGSATEGAMSTTLDKILPNGWEFAVSNEVYMDNDGISYENIGIPVDYELNYPRDRQVFFRSVVNDLEKDKRQILLTIKNIIGN